MGAGSDQSRFGVRPAGAGGADATCRDLCSSLVIAASKGIGARNSRTITTRPEMINAMNSAGPANSSIHYLIALAMFRIFFSMVCLLAEGLPRSRRRRKSDRGSFDQVWV